MKVAVLGAAGGIGQPLSLILKSRLPAGSELALYDVAPFTPGVAVDLSHIPTDVNVEGFTGDEGLAKAVSNADETELPITWLIPHQHKSSVTIGIIAFPHPLSAPAAQCVNASKNKKNATVFPCPTPYSIASGVLTKAPIRYGDA